MTGTPRQTEGNPPYDFAGGTVTTANPFDTRTIANGTHTMTAAVDLADGTTSVASATFTVLNGGTPSGPLDQIHLAWVGDPATTLDVIWHTAGLSVPHEAQYRKTGETTWITATGAARPSGTAGVLHEVQLTGLSPDTSYEYRVRGPSSTWSSVFETMTAPAIGSQASFDAVYVADTGIVGRLDGLTTGTQQVIDEIARLDPRVVLGGGDYAYFNTDSRFPTLDSAIDAWFNQMQPIARQAPFMPAYGNHEGGPNSGENIASWTARFATPAGFDSRRNYSFDIGDVHFVSVYAVLGNQALPSATATWLEQDMQAAQDAGARWIIPFFHVAPFATGTNHPSNLALRAQLGPLFERMGVKVAVFSHDQSYERTYPLVDVPATNTRTSTSKSCYTMADGVSWVKVSPGGKLSNISRGFSPWASSTPSSFTAVRDNTQHHFVRLRVSAGGELLVEIFGVKGDGTPATVVDSFKYTTGSCGTPPPPSSHILAYSTSSSRSSPAALDGATVSGKIFAFTSPDTADITRVRFWLDNPQMTGTPRRTENGAPYDFAGGTVSTAKPFDTRAIANGAHTITAAIDLREGTTAVASATFTVQNGASSLLAALARHQPVP